jgi:hypothetical protein
VRNESKKHRTKANKSNAKAKRTEQKQSVRNESEKRQTKANESNARATRKRSGPIESKTFLAKANESNAKAERTKRKQNLPPGVGDFVHFALKMSRPAMLRPWGGEKWDF